MTFHKWTAVAAFLMLAPVGAQAQLQQQMPSPFPDMMKGTPQEQAACAPDSNRFCKQFEPDSMRVLGCLQQNRERISKSCQQVLRNRGV